MTWDALARLTGVRLRNVLNVWLPRLDTFVLLCQALNLDYFEICELLYLQPLPGDVVRGFKAACREAKKSPLQVLYELMSVYADSIPRRRHVAKRT